ncbi:nucleotidyl transferase AbiEii/AbiGii toxin family protein [Neorhizobium sp. JUb45]|uniref:nucleotidyl transferase AbiEii/AbiGii toxin family protein n=1 Tax=unclassified Neorhizobium TaxID=2629175 RepID=UPI0010513726|nr:nucleotidyl transferase AbiEii/AbiGii toxin family protein [Neorhizobium sp. JUb45]TCR06741.1 hypothetical protein EDF70_101702 [Neorhizobium sp. JUb45]
MAPTSLQKAIMEILAQNRSASSYLAGGVVLNRDWPRQSDDIDIFQDTDEEIGSVATRDIDNLRRHGFDVSIDVFIYGCVEASVGRDGEATLIQWMSEARQRFMPLVDDPGCGIRLHQADLAVNKVLAASTRRKARDYVDLLLIEENFCLLGPIIMAAAGKPPHFSPVRIIDEIRHKGLSIASEDYQSVKGLPTDYDPASIREKLERALQNAQAYIRIAPIDLVGLLAVDADGRPIEVHADTAAPYEIRRASIQTEIMPAFADQPGPWQVPSDG